jgi:hypothetical protein
MAGGVDQVTRKRDLGTNICPVEFRAPAFEVWARDVAEGEDLGALRDAYAPSWTVQRDRAAMLAGRAPGYTSLGFP